MPAVFGWMTLQDRRIARQRAKLSAGKDGLG